MQISHQKDVYDMERPIRLIHDDTSSSRGECDKLGMCHEDAATVRQVNSEWLKRTLIVKLAKILNRHGQFLFCDAYSSS